jgi:hypothetical protein
VDPRVRPEDDGEWGALWGKSRDVGWNWSVSAA